MPLPIVHIPKPCPVGPQALTPTEAGWHCARCRTEVIDFTRLSEAEVLAYLAERQGHRVCAAMRVPLVPQHYQRPRGPRWWLMAVAALLGWQSAEALPQLPPNQLFLRLAAGRERIVIRGVVLDDSLNVPVAGARLFIKGTKYGAVTNEKGEFSFSFASDWNPAAKGELVLEVSADHFTFKSQLIVVSFRDSPPPAPLIVRLLSLPQRGNIMGKIRITPPPVAPPGAGRN